MTPEEQKRAELIIEDRKVRKHEVIAKNLEYLPSTFYAAFPLEYKEELIKLMEYVYDDAFRDGQDWAILKFDYMLQRRE